MSGFDDEDKVGYGKPPKRSRFVQGESGNPKGRPKKPVKNFASELQSELDRKVVVRENGREGAVIVKTLDSKAMKGDVRALREIRELLPKLFQLQADPKRTSASSDDDARLLNQFLALFGGRTGQPEDDQQSSSTDKEPGNVK
jgi:hypothetical protein